MLPEKFKIRMNKLLGDEYPAFEHALTHEKEKKGFRINILKYKTENFLKANRFKTEPLSYVNDGFLLLDMPEKIGNTPEHASGQIYVQDPGAMASAAALDIEPGMLVADLCAAPGGKSTQVASALRNEGYILSNEYVPKRAKILVSNFERMGIRCATVTSMDTAEIAKLYENIFDIVIVDAPCSGEGMFRKDVPATEEWSEENVERCSKRQQEILENASKILKPDGKLLYSTCTYSLEENEMVVDSFLKYHPEFSLCETKEEIRKVTSPGLSFVGAYTSDLYKCRRFYPHKSPGEGQFIALLTKKGGGVGSFKFKSGIKAPTKEEIKAIEDFFKQNLSEAPSGAIAKYGENLVLISHDVPIPPSKVFSAGVLIGEIRGKLLYPSHQFFSAYGSLFKRKVELSYDDARKYLAGEELADNTGLDSGYCAVNYNGSTIGGGKISDGRIKNHYPKGLRIR